MGARAWFALVAQVHWSAGVRVLLPRYHSTSERCTRRPLAVPSTCYAGPAMSTEVAAILERARALRPADQAELAVAIVALLDDVADEPAQVEREWAEELSLRAERAASGESVGRPWAEVRDRLLARPR